MAGQLQLALLGNLEICQDGVPVTELHSGKGQALLCYLAVTGRPHLRPTLTGLLWGDMPEASARSNLSKALTYLRQVVGHHLSITRQAIAFDRGNPYWLDVEVFESQVRSASSRAVSSQPNIGQLQRAVELYRGDFLEGFYVRQAPAFEDWILAQRVRFRELALDTLYTLAAYHSRQGPAGHAAGIDYTTRLLVMEPWLEEAHQLMMVLLVQNGQRSAALAQYETCRQMLADELSVEPGTETTALYERIRDGKSNLAQGEPKTRSILNSEPLTVPPSLSAGSAPDRSLTHFVTRERELTQLDTHLERALDGEGRIAFITGEAGTGKTALIGEFARRAQARYTELVVAGGNCNAFTGTGDPYLPFRQILEQLTGDVESRWAAGTLSPEGTYRLWNLIPTSVRALLDASPALIDAFLAGPSLENRGRLAAPNGAHWLDRLEENLASRKVGSANLRQASLFEQTMVFLAALSRQHPLLLILDDLHWADAARSTCSFTCAGGSRLSAS